MAQLKWPFMQSLLGLLMMLNMLNDSNAASLVRPPPLDDLLLISNLTGVSSPNSSGLSAGYSNRRLIDAVKEVYWGITGQYPRAFLVGVRVKFSGTGSCTALRVSFTNTALSTARGITEKLNPQNGQWEPPQITTRDPGIGNNYMFVDALAFDITDAVTILKKTYPRATFTAAYIYSPKNFQGFRNQPYWIFSMTQSILWDRYLWVGVRDWKVAASDRLPQSIAVLDAGLGVEDY